MRVESKLARDTMRHPDVFEIDVRPASAAEKAAARLFVNRHATSAHDLGVLLAMLDLTDEGVQ